jgi:chemotaxis response regulator CheB
MRIAIVNDMFLAVEALRRVVSSVPDYEIAWVARNGVEAVEKCAADTPDVVLMDLIMPFMDGVEATRRIMAASPCLILVVTATVGGHAAKVFEAMGYGARDAVNTPVLGKDGRVEGGAALLAKIATLEKLLDTKPRQAVRRRVIPTAPAPACDLPGRAEGLAVLRRAGWYIMAQDQASSVVYGMPKAAAEAGAAMQIVSLEAMAFTLVRFFGETAP